MQPSHRSDFRAPEEGLASLRQSCYSQAKAEAMNPAAAYHRKKPATRRKDAPPLLAALDLGTNNCRLLIVEAPEQRDPPATLKVVDSFSRIVRLGEGLTARNDLSQEAIDRTIEALKHCRKKLDKYHPARSRFVATEACRRARNAKSFLAQAQEKTGMKIEIISAEEEANLAFKGCASLLKPEPKHAMVFDIGGGSTEFMRVEIGGKPDKTSPLLPHKVVEWFSLPHGVMNLSEKFGGSAFAEIYYEEMVSYLMERIESFDSSLMMYEAAKAQQLQLLSTSGTVTTLAAIYLGLPKYERTKIDGITLSVAKLRQAIEATLHMRASERFNHPCIGSDRSDYIISGCAIFEAVCRLWPVKDVTIADRGVREGIIMSMLAETAQKRAS
jgi:exopolyphosphatase / guanosine-5'-triphosphate,3'-diphosphate pyrophosphatase